MINLFMEFPLHFFFAILTVFIVNAMLWGRKEEAYAILGITALAFMILYSLDIAGVIIFISK